MTVVLIRREERKASHSVSFIAVQDKRLTAVSATACLYTLSLSNLYRWLVVCGGGTHSLLDLTSHGEESLFDVAGILG
jgi:hypothetical protein